MNTIDMRAVRVEQTLRKLLDASVPFAAHGWTDAELEDDNCQLTRNSGAITVGDWRALRLAVQEASAAFRPAAEQQTVTSHKSRSEPSARPVSGKNTST